MIRDLRATVIPAAFGGWPSHVYVTGNTAGVVDYLDFFGTWMPIAMAVVLSLSFVLLLLAFRSVVIPAKAILMNLLSVGAAYGLLVLVFQKGVGAGLLGMRQVDTIEAWVPLMLFCLLFGLSMDYQVFLLSRIKERFDRTGDTREAVAHGVGRTAGIITGAAAIMVCVFAGMAGGELVMFQQMGFGLAVAIFIDATIVRTIIVPAAMELLGDWNWYLPRWLEWLPNVSVEGHVPEAPARRRRRRDSGDGSPGGPAGDAAGAARHRLPAGRPTRPPPLSRAGGRGRPQAPRARAGAGRLEETPGSSRGRAGRRQAARPPSVSGHGSRPASSSSSRPRAGTSRRVSMSSNTEMTGAKSASGSIMACRLRPSVKERTTSPTRRR